MERIEYKQVGSTCLKDFTGVDPTWAANAFGLFSSIDTILDDPEFTGFGGGVGFTLEAAVAAACAAVRNFGWVKASAYEGVPTKVVITDILLKTKNAVEIEIEEQDVEQATKVIDLVRSTEVTNDFLHNQAVVFAHEYVTYDHYGLIAAAVGMYSTNVAKIKAAAEKAQADAEKSNEWIGSEKERLTLKLTVLSVSERPGYGYDQVTYLTKLEDETGNAFTWWGSRRLDEDATYEGKWTVKKHDEYQGRKQTTILRPAKLVEV